MAAIGDIEDPRATTPAEPFRTERLAGVVNAVSDPITVQAAAGRVVFANLAAARARSLRKTAIRSPSTVAGSES